MIISLVPKAISSKVNYNTGRHTCMLIPHAPIYSYSIYDVSIEYHN